MGLLIPSNNIYGTLSSAITDTDTTVSLQSATQFPTFNAGDFTYMTLIGTDGVTLEVVKVTNRAGGVLTVERAAEAIAGTNTASAFPIGSRLEWRITSAMLKTLYATNRSISKGQDIASSAILTLEENANSYNVTGNASITGISSAGVSARGSGELIRLRFTGSPTLVHSAGFALSGGVNYQPSAGDYIELESQGGGTYYEVDRTQPLAFTAKGQTVRMAFMQPSAPTYWTQVTTFDGTTSVHDYLFRSVNVVGGSTGLNGTGGWGHAGTDSPILNNKVPSHTHPDDFAIAAVGDHAHGPVGNGFMVVGSSFPVVTGAGSAYNFWNSTALTANAGAHTHSLNGTVLANAGASNWTPKYINQIICQRTF